MNTEKTGYFARLTAALLGRDLSAPAPEPPAPKPAPTPDASGATELSAEVATLKMDLQERDERIVQMRAEYKALEHAKERVAAEAGHDGVEKLLKRLSGPLATLAGVASLAEAGEDVELSDVIQQIRTLEKALARAGMEPIGAVGERVEFDVSGHQRMSGGRVEPGALVTVRLPGYRLGDRVLTKAIITAAEDEAEEKSNG